VLLLVKTNLRACRRCLILSWPLLSSLKHLSDPLLSLSPSSDSYPIVQPLENIAQSCRQRQYPPLVRNKQDLLALPDSALYYSITQQLPSSSFALSFRPFLKKRCWSTRCCIPYRLRLSKTSISGKRNFLPACDLAIPSCLVPLRRHPAFRSTALYPITGNCNQLTRRYEDQRAGTQQTDPFPT